MRVFQQQLDFILELDRLKAVYRKTLVKADDDRQENSAEHSWHIAMLASVFSEYADQEVDISRVVLMLLIHDIVEIDAGDMFAFAEAEDHSQQAEKEAQAAQRIFGLLPEQQAQTFIDMWFEFELAHSPDAKFAKSIDRVLPVFQNMSNGGGSWKRHGVSSSQVLARNELLKDSAPKLYHYVTQQTEIAITNGWLIDK